MSYRKPENPKLVQSWVRVKGADGRYRMEARWHAPLAHAIAPHAA